MSHWHISSCVWQQVHTNGVRKCYETVCLDSVIIIRSDVPIKRSRRSWNDFATFKSCLSNAQYALVDLKKKNDAFILSSDSEEVIDITKCSSCLFIFLHDDTNVFLRVIKRAKWYIKRRIVKSALSSSLEIRSTEVAIECCVNVGSRHLKVHLHPMTLA